MKNPGIKIPFLRTQGYPIVEGTRCVEVRIPDDDAYMAVLAGLVAIATKWFNYSRDDEHTGTQLAAMWRKAYVETDWEGCMTCEELQACIQPLLDAQTQNILDLLQYGMEDPGQPMTDDERDENMAGDTNPTCDLDILWAQSLAYVQDVNNAIVDVFEQIEAATNVVELLDVAQSIPLVKYVTNAVGIEAAISFVEYWQEAIQEEYQAQYTITPVTGAQDKMAFALFCACKSDCEITVDRIFQVWSSRVTSIITNPDLIGNLTDLAEVIAGVDFDSSLVVDAMFWLVAAGMKVGQFFMGDTFSANTLKMLLALAVDDASSDWMLMGDCPVECNDYDFSLDNFYPDWKIRQNTPPEAMSVWVDGVGYEPREQIGGNFENQIYTVLNFGCSTLEYTYTCPNVPTQVALYWCNSSFSVLSLAATLTAASGTVTDTVDLSALTPPPGATGFLLVSGNLSDGDYVVTWQSANFS